MKVVAKVLLVDPSGKVLVLRRSKTHPRYALQLDFPGGEVESGELPNEAVTREVAEETGLEIQPESLEFLHERHIRNDLHHILFQLQLPGDQTNIVLSWEHDQSQWLSSEELIYKSIPEGADDYYETVISYLREQL